MNTNENGMIRVVLRKRIILSDHVTFDAEREVGLPIAPFVGLHLYNDRWVPPGCDGIDEPIEEVGVDLRSGRTLCYLPTDDYRPESSGSSDWTEDDVRQRYGTGSSRATLSAGRDGTVNGIDDDCHSLDQRRPGERPLGRRPLGTSARQTKAAAGCLTLSTREGV